MRQYQCSCMGESLDRFLRPLVMAVLARTNEGLHGYLLAQELQTTAMFSDVPPDNTGLYRALKSMEEEGYLVSEWDVEGAGPAKRVYHLTPSGRECLQQWKVTLETYDTSLQNTIEYIGKSLELKPAKRRKTK